MNDLTGKHMLFLTSWPHGEIRQVKILQYRDDIRSPFPHYYIKYLDGKRIGGTDTTSTEFLFDIPKSFTLKDDRIEAFTEKVVILNRNLTATREAMQYFVDRVEGGTARSTRTYNKFKKILEETK